MANSRKDSRGYVLKTGEFQRKDGRYSYSYTDKEGKRHTVYENSLAELRKKERQIIRDIEDGIDAHAPEKITLNDLWDKYIGQKYDLKPTTRANYKYCYDLYVRDGFGKRKIVPKLLVFYNGKDAMPDDFVIKPFLIANRAEVNHMILTEYDEKKTMEMFARDARKEQRELDEIEIEEKDKALAEMKAEKNKALAEKDAEIARLKQQIAEAENKK